MATLEEKAFASMATRKREQISNNVPPERFMGDVYCNGFKNGYRAAVTEIPAQETIIKIINLVLEFTKENIVRENVSPIVQEYIDKITELTDNSEPADNDKLLELLRYYEVKYVQENWIKQ